MQNKSSEVVPYVKWQLVSFGELDTNTFFELLKLRIGIFVVEQECAYAELDEYDRAPNTLHLLGKLDSQHVSAATSSTGSELVACARLLIASSGSAKIGRVAVRKDVRGKGLARELMLYLFEHTAGSEPPVGLVELSAQVYAQGFYESLGFSVVSEEYIEDGIPHVDMRREGTA